MPARRLLAVLSLLLLSYAPAAAEIAATADVVVSDGTEFRAEMTYEAPQRAVYLQQFPDGSMRFETDGETVSVQRDGTELTSIPDGMAAWILGHQFHAQITRFATINGGIVMTAPYQGNGECPCTEYRGRLSSVAMGIEGYGLVVSDATGRPQRLLVHRRDQAPVVSQLEDWRVEDGRQLPYRIVVDDGEQVFEFAFTAVRFG